MIKNIDYYKPESVAEVLHLFDELGGKSVILAGGTDLMIAMKNGLLMPDNLINIKDIPELNRIELTEEGLFIGAGVNCNQLINNEGVNKNYPLLVEAVKTLASHQVRNRATIVGNLCNASPGADTAPALLVLGTEVLITSKKGEEMVPLDKFFTGVKRTRLKDNEIVTGLRVEPPFKDARGSYLKKSRTKGPDLSAVGVAGLFSRRQKTARLAYSAVAVTPVLVDVSKIIFADEGDPETKTDRVLEAVRERINPITDVRSTREYRLKVAGIYTRRLLNLLVKEGDL